MTHTERKAKIDQLLADNTKGDISAADVREIDTMTSQDLQSTEDNTQVALNRIGALGLDASGTNLMTTKEIELQGTQVVPVDPAHALADKRLMSIGNVFKAFKDYGATLANKYMPLLDKDNPTMMLHVSPAGHAAQMQVLNNGHTVASMEWEKGTQEFFFSLSDKDSGVLKAQFEIKPDGHAYIGGQRITTTEDGNPSGLFQYDYKIKMSAADPTPSVSHISFDDIDFTKTTKLYINKKDRTKTDMSLFLSAIDKGDYFNIHDNNDINQFVAFDVIGKAVQNGDVFEVPVKHYDDNGTLTDNERVYIHWQKPEFIIATIKNVSEIHGRGLYDGVDVIGAASQGHIIINVLADSLGNLDLSQKDETGRRTDGGKAVGQAIKWHTVNADHLFGTAVPANTLGHDGDLYFKLT